MRPDFIKTRLIYDRKLIGLYNHLSNKFVAGAPIKNQAYGDYLYGKDGEIETALSNLEGHGARLMSTMKETFVPPSVNENAFNVFKRYMLAQMYRTKRAGQQIEEAINKGMHAMWQLHPEYNEKLKDIRVKHEFPELLMLAWSQRHLPLLDYLDCKLLVNLSEIPFITSDAPVIAYNQMMESKGYLMGSTALSVKGLQLFFPIYNRMMVCLYHPVMYDYQGKNEFCIITESKEDVHQLNALQYLNSGAQVYFDDYIPEDYVRDLVASYKHQRKNSGPVSKSIIEKDGVNERYFIINSSIDPFIHLSLSFVHLTDDAKSGNPGINRNYRHPSFENLREEMEKTEEEESDID